MTDTCKNNVSKFVLKPFKSPLHYANENVSVKHLSLICITSILITDQSLKNCSVYERSCHIYSTKSFGYFQKEFC